MNKPIINCLYSHFKNTPKKLKIVCDWDEVIQAHEPYAEWLMLRENPELRPFLNKSEWSFPQKFKEAWGGQVPPVKYSNYGSRINWSEDSLEYERQQEIKNSPNFYQQAPFLTIAKELLMLIKAGKVARLIFLSAYDKRKFPNSDERKEQIFKETFDKVGYPHEKEENHTVLPCYLELIPFNSEIQSIVGDQIWGQTKADWIKKNAADFDIVIDDNPNICRSIEEIKEKQNQEIEEGGFIKHGHELLEGKINPNILTIAPYYPAIENQHDERVLLIKTSVSNLTKEDFK